MGDSLFYISEVVDLNLVEIITGIAGTDAIVIPDAVWFCPDLTPTDIKLYKVLLDYGSLIYDLPNGKMTLEGYPIVTVSQERLSQKVGVSVKTVQTSLKRLKRVKLIKIDDNNGFKRNNNVILTGEFFGITPAFSRERRLCEVEQEIKRVPIKRVPIKIDRTPAMTSYESKLRELGGFTYKEKAILALSKHYDMLVSQFNHFTGYRSLSKTNPQGHRNWKSFEKLHELCDGKGWEANLYLDAQFDRAKKWWKDSKMKYPTPNMLCSEKSKAYFEKYLEDRAEKYGMDVGGKERIQAQKTVSLKQKTIQDVVRSVESISMYIREDVSAQEQAEDKAVRLFHAWESYSAAYLYSVPWFREYLREVQLAQPDNKRAQQVAEEFSMFDRSKPLQQVIQRAVELSEDQFGVPKNIAI